MKHLLRDSSVLKIISYMFSKGCLGIFIFLVIILPALGTDAAIKKMTVRGDYSYPPYEFLDETGQPAGYNVDIFKAVAEVMGLEYELRLGPWNQVRRELETREVDMLIGMFYSELRDQQVDFSTPHLIIHHAIFVRKGSAIKTESDLYNKAIIVQRDDIMHDYVKEKGFSDNLILTESQPQALRLLASGKDDCFLGAEYQGLYIIRKYRLSNVVSVCAPIYPQEYGFAVTEGNTELLSALNEGLIIIKQTGRFDEINNKWFGLLTAPKGISVRKIAVYSVIILIPLLLVILGTLLWSRSLRRQVSHKTRELQHELAERRNAESLLKETYDIINKSPAVAFLWKNQEGWPVEYVTDNVKALFGYTAEELLSGNSAYSETIHPDDLEQVAGEVRQYSNEPNRISFTHKPYRIISKEGQVKWIEDSTFIRRDEDGKITHYQGVLIDITEKKQTQEALQESEKRYHGALDHMMEGCQIIDYDWRYLYINDAATRHGRRTKEELLGRRMMSVYPQIEQTELFIALRRCMAERQPRQMENEFTYADGSKRWFKLSVQPVPEGLFILSFDITERKQTENALRESEQRLKAAQKIAKIGDFIWNVKTHEVTWSDSLYDITGYDKSEPINYSLINDKIHHPDDLERIRQWFRDCLSSGRDELTTNEYRAIRKDGWVIIVRTMGVIEHDNGKPLRVFATVQDVTERRQAEQEKARIEEQYFQIQKLESIGGLAGGVAHDLNNLLTPIIGFGEVLLENLSDDELNSEAVREIINAGNRARDLVRQLLAFSRKQTLEHQNINLNDLLKNFEQLIHRTVRENIVINMSLQESLPIITGDVGQLEQVVMNLVVNAQDAMPEGGTLAIKTSMVELDEIYAKAHQGVTPGSYVMLAISDTGCGMDAETLEHIFEPFFTTKTKEMGTGLGLSTVYGIVKQHGGNIWAYSEPGLGTTIRVYLPVSAESSEASVIKPHDLEALTDLKGSETILLVEDDKSVRNITFAILKRKGYVVLVAESGQDALSILNRHAGPVHLLLTDVIMPEMNGRELYEQASGISPGIKVLFMSGYADDVIAHSGVIGKDIHFIEKPFSINTMAAKLRKVLDEE